MEQIVKIGIIGCGGIANSKHMPALSKLEDVQMVAFCDIIEGGKGCERIWNAGCPRVYRLQGTAQREEYRCGTCFDTQPGAQLYHRGKLGSGKACYVRKTHGQDYQRGPSYA